MTYECTYPICHCSNRNMCERVKWNGKRMNDTQCLLWAPREPTEAMYNAAVCAFDRHGYTDPLSPLAVSAIWRAMYDAAPPAVAPIEPTEAMIDAESPETDMRAFLLSRGEKLNGAPMPTPVDGWLCFHCGERFKTFGAAEDHFGKTPKEAAGCVIKLGNERGLLMELRKAEALAAERERDARRWVALTTKMTTSAVNDAIATAFRTSHFRNALAHIVDAAIGAPERKEEAE